jgi:hypothetical protein
MRRFIPILGSLIVFLTIALVSARRMGTHRAPADVPPPIEPTSRPDGDDQAPVIVQTVEIVPSDRPGGHIHAIQGVPRMQRLAYVVTFKVTGTLRGRFDEPELRILVHSPSADLGVRQGSRRGILHRYRSGSGGRYQFVPE